MVASTKCGSVLSPDLAEFPSCRSVARPLIRIFLFLAEIIRQTALILAESWKKVRRVHHSKAINEVDVLFEHP